MLGTSKMLVAGPHHQRIWFNCSVVWSSDSNVQPRWTLIESKLTSQIKSVNFLRGCVHSTFPVRGLISDRSNIQLSAQRPYNISNYLSMIEQYSLYCTYEGRKLLAFFRKNISIQDWIKIDIFYIQLIKIHFILQSLNVPGMSYLSYPYQTCPQHWGLDY